MRRGMGKLGRLFLGLNLLVAACNGEITGAASGGDGGVGTLPDAFPGISSDARVCAAVEIQLEKQVPDVLLLLDQSGSMTAGFGGTDRWHAMYQTLMDPVTGVVKTLESEVRFGLALYTSTGGSAGGVCPILTQVPIALDNFAAIDAVFAPAVPRQDTPTGESIDAVTAELTALPPPMGPRIIVLATDGLPDSCADPNALATAQSVASAQAAWTAGFPLYVISVGDDVQGGHFQDMANAGAGLPIGGATNAPYYRALQPSDLVTAFQEIIGGVRSCVFTLDGAVDPALAGGGHVVLDGNELTFGSDWRLNDQSTLEVLGAACDALLAGGDHELKASFTCDAIIG
jgi:hypothetical protein